MPTKRPVKLPESMHYLRKQMSMGKCPNASLGLCTCGRPAIPETKHPALQAGIIKGNVCPFDGDWDEAFDYCPGYKG